MSTLILSFLECADRTERDLSSRIGFSFFMSSILYAIFLRIASCKLLMNLAFRFGSSLFGPKPVSPPRRPIPYCFRFSMYFILAGSLVILPPVLTIEPFELSETPLLVFKTVLMSDLGVAETLRLFPPRSSNVLSSVRGFILSSRECSLVS